MFYLIGAWIDGWVNHREAGDLRRHRAHYDVIVMLRWLTWIVARNWISDPHSYVTKWVYWRDWWRRWSPDDRCPSCTFSGHKRQVNTLFNVWEYQGSFSGNDNFVLQVNKYINNKREWCVVICYLWCLPSMVKFLLIKINSLQCIEILFGTVWDISLI